MFALPIIFAADEPGIWWAVLAIGLACACHQGFSANLFAMPGDLFPQRTTDTVIEQGGLTGSTGTTLMAKFAGVILAGVGGYGPMCAVHG